MSNSSRPHGLQPTRLLCPWDFPGKSTGAGCHCLLRSGPWPHSNYVPESRSRPIAPESMHFVLQPWLPARLRIAEGFSNTADSWPCCHLPCLPFPVSPPSRPVVLKLWYASEYPRGLVKTRTAGPCAQLLIQQAQSGGWGKQGFKFLTSCHMMQMLLVV